MRGSVRLAVKIGPNGEVLGTSASGGTGLSGSVIGCLANRVGTAQFDAPLGGGATVIIPVTLIPQ
jgi:hypothetical protein